MVLSQRQSSDLRKVIMDRMTKEIYLLGQGITLCERSAEDIFTLISRIEAREEKRSEQSIGHQYIDSLYFNCEAISDSIKIYIDSLPFYHFLKKWHLKKKYSANNLLKALSPQMIMKLINIISVELEGNKPIKIEESKKKRIQEKDSQSAEQIVDR